MKFLLFLCEVAVIFAASSSKKTTPSKETFRYGAELPLDMHVSIRNVSSSKNCSVNSPVNQIKYNYTKVHEVKSADFCYHYSPRTCCSVDNFNTLRMNFYKQVYQNQDLSTDCQQALQQLICYDCDGDVGQGIRKGICLNQCESIYDICRNDYFSIEQSTKKIKVCNNQDMVCSKLSDIVTAKSEFCQLLGYEINDFTDYEEWYLSLDSEQVGKSFTQYFKPVCWNFAPSSNIFGPAPIAVQKKYSPTATNTNSFANTFSNKVILYVLYGLLGIVVLFVGAYIIVYCYYSKKSKKREEGRIIGGSFKNHRE